MTDCVSQWLCGSRSVTQCRSPEYWCSNELLTVNLILSCWYLNARRTCFVLIRKNVHYHLWYLVSRVSISSTEDRPSLVPRLTIRKINRQDRSSSLDKYDCFMENSNGLMNTMTLGPSYYSVVVPRISSHDALCRKESSFGLINIPFSSFQVQKLYGYQAMKSFADDR